MLRNSLLINRLKFQASSSSQSSTPPHTTLSMQPNLNWINSIRTSQRLFTQPVLTLHLPHSTFFVFVPKPAIHQNTHSRAKCGNAWGCQYTHNMVIRATKQQQFNVSHIHSLVTYSLFPQPYAYKFVYTDCSMCSIIYPGGNWRKKQII